jgi:hypothetical protein
MIKVRIKKVPKARTGYQVRGALVNDVPAMGGADYNAYIGAPKLRESKYITAVPREEANLEAEGGETVYGDINGDGMPEHKIIKGPRHAQGGVPLKLPEDTFIFSDTRAMRIKDPEILSMFGKGGINKSYTPAELAKQYDVQKYRKILEDPETDAIERKTAELMIKKFVVKLGCLALAQESMKGFPQGVPAVAKPCMEARGLTEEDVMPNKEITVLNEQLKKQMEQQEGGGDENMLQQAEDTNEGNPVAQPEEQMQPQEQMQQPSPEEMMRYGGMRRLRRAQEGMQQPSQEEMAMMQQQGQPQEQGGGDQMGQVIEEVQAALERGAEPSEVVMSLLQNGIPPEGIVQIFAQLGASPEEAAGLVQQVMGQAQGGGQEQMMQEQPSMEGQPMSEEEAMMMQQQQMQQQAPPMAAYGMSMGGYDMPFYDIPQAAYGMSMGSGMSQNYQGRPKRIPGSGPMFPLKKAQDGIQVNYDPSWDSDPAKREKALRLAYVQAKKKGANTKIYVVKDGKSYEQKVSATGHTEYKGSDLDKWNGNQVAAATYEAMSQTFNDPEAKHAYAEQVRKTLADPKAYVSKSGSSSKSYKERFNKDPKDLTDDEIVGKYLRMQERNLKTSTYGSKIGLPEGAPFGSWMYKDATGDIRAFDSTGDAKKDKRGFKDVVKDAYTAQGKTPPSDAEIKAMYDKVNTPAYNSLDKISKDIGLPIERKYKTNADGVRYLSGEATDAFAEEVYLQQAGFQAADRLMKDLDANPNNYDDETAESLLGITSFAGFSPYGKQVGYNDETGMDVSTISPADAYYTNTTQGEIQAHHGLKFEDIPPNVDPDCQCDDPKGANYSQYKDEKGNCTCTPPKDKPKPCPCQKSDGTVLEMTQNADGTCPPCTEDKDIDVPGPAPEWWLQDTIKTTGAFGDLMGIKKHMPWAPGVDLETPRPTFLDPTRELAANAEQANIQTQGMAQFAGPQALSARSASVQGQAAKNAADVLSKYNNANVNIANQFEMKATDIRNQEGMLKQATAQRVYDQNTVANQQFDNAKLAMRNNLRNYYTNAITNKEKTDALNQMYPNYAVSPAVGGRMNFVPTQKQVTGQGSSSMTMQEAMDWCKKNNPNATDHSACMQRVMNQQGGGSGGGTGANANAVNTMYPGQQMGGPVYEDGGFVHINSWLPFIL